MLCEGITNLVFVVSLKPFAWFRGFVVIRCDAVRRDHNGDFSGFAEAVCMFKGPL